MTHLYLDSDSTIKAVKSMMRNSKNGIVCTFSHEKNYPTIESMQTRDIDSHGNMWYILSSDSISYKNLMGDNRITVIFTAPAESNFLRVIGTAKISESADRIDKYWSNSDETKFNKGKTDPRIKLLKIIIDSSHYLKFPSNNVIDILKLLGRTIAGREDLSD